MSDWWIDSAVGRGQYDLRLRATERDWVKSPEYMALCKRPVEKEKEDD